MSAGIPEQKKSKLRKRESSCRLFLSRTKLATTRSTAFKTSKLRTGNESMSLREDSQNVTYTIITTRTFSRITGAIWKITVRHVSRLSMHNGNQHRVQQLPKIQFKSEKKSPDSVERESGPFGVAGVGTLGT